MGKHIVTLIVLISFIFSGCGNQALNDSTTLAPLLNAYTQNNQLIKDRYQQSLQEGIHQLTIDKAVNSDDLFLIGVDLEEAFLTIVVERLLKETGLQYSMRDNLLRGNVTAKFENKPYLDALNILLNPRNYSARMANDIITIQGGFIAVSQNVQSSSSDSSDSDTDSKPSYSVEMPIYYLDTDAVSQLLSSLYPQDADEVKVRFGIISESNTIFLNGDPASVQQALEILQNADQEQDHVLIEVLVVEYIREDIEVLLSEFNNIANSSYSNGTINFGSIINLPLQFTYNEDENNAAAFTAMLDILLSTDRAKLISRPYLSTISGKKATLNITTDRHIVIQSIEGGGSHRRFGGNLRRF